MLNITFDSLKCIAETLLIFHFIFASLAALHVLMLPFAGHDQWYKTYPACGHKSQSPIHLPEKDSIHKKFSSFQFTGYNTRNSSDKFNIKNNGHTIQITIDNYAGMSVQGFGTYTLHQLLNLFCDTMILISNSIATWYFDSNFQT